MNFKIYIIFFLIFSFLATYYFRAFTLKKIKEELKARDKNEVLEKLNSISPYFIICILHFEDPDFYLHKGVDWNKLFKQVKNLFLLKKVTGASTITQQLARARFVNINKSFKRKIKCIFYALLIEKIYSKDEILLLYFESIFWERFEPIQGIEDASKLYFSKNPKELNLIESIVLAFNIRSSNVYAYNIFYNKLEQKEISKYYLQLFKILSFIKNDDETKNIEYYDIKNRFSKPFFLHEISYVNRSKHLEIISKVYDEFSRKDEFFDNIRYNFNKYSNFTWMEDVI